MRSFGLAGGAKRSTSAYAGVPMMASCCTAPTTTRIPRLAWCCPLTRSFR